MRYLARCTAAGVALLVLAAAPAAAEPPPNDHFAQAELVSGSSLQLDGTNQDATAEPGEPGHRGFMARHSVWYRWVAPASGTVQLQLAHPLNVWSPHLAAYTGATLATLTRVPSASTFPWGNDGEERFAVTAGTVIHIAVDSDYGDGGGFTLYLTRDDAPPNDHFADAEVLSGADATADGTNRGSTMEAGEPGEAAGSTWYEWTAPASDAVTIEAAGGAEAVLAVYTGDSVGGLTRVAFDHGYDYNAYGSTYYNGARLAFRATAGVRYRIQAVGYHHSSHGSVGLHLTTRPPPANDAFDSATPLAGSASLTATGRNDGATAEPSEPAPDPSHPARHSAWFSWTAPASGSLTVRTTAPDALLAVYTGSAVNALTRVPLQPRDPDIAATHVRVRVEAGVTYRIAADSRSDNTGDFELSLGLLERPGNDDFAGAQPITGLEADVDGANRGATQEACEPGHDGSDRNVSDPSVWYEWTAPATGGVVVAARGDFRTVVAVYTGGDLCALTRVEPTENRYSEASGTAKFRAEAGVTYRIAVDGYSAAWGRFTLSLRHRPPPANDAFATPEPLSGEHDEASGDNIGGSVEAGEPWFGGTGSSTVWYAWTAPVTGSATVRLPSKDFESVVEAYTGSTVDGLAQVSRGLGSDWLSAAFRIQAGTTYRIRVRGWDDPRRGDFALSLDSFRAPANDAFADAVVLSGSSASAEGTVTAASREPDEPSHSGDYEAGTVWYRWTAPANGRVTVAMRRGGAAIATYAGDSLGALQRVDGGPDSSGGPSKFVAEAGRTYRIAVAAAWEVPSSFEIAIDQAAPPNDDFAASSALTANAGLVAGGNRQATSEPGEPGHGYGHFPYSSVWYHWTAPSDGVAELQVADADFEVAKGVYTGASVGSLTQVTRGTGGYDRFVAKAGETYRIAVDGQNGYAFGSFRIGLRLHPHPPNDDLVDAASLGSDAAVATAGSTGGGTYENGEPIHSRHGGASVWYRWTPLTSGRTTAEVSREPSFAVAVYEGAGYGTLKRVASSDDPYASRVFDAQAGQTYLVAVDGLWLADHSWFQLWLTQEGSDRATAPDPPRPPESASPPQEPGAEQPSSGEQRAPEPRSSDTPRSAPAASAPEGPLRIWSRFRKQKLADVLATGVYGNVTCSATCKLTIRVRDGKRILRTLRANAGQLGRALTIALPKAERARLRRMRPRVLTVEVRGSSAAGQAEQASQVKLRR